ncbi:hypothetical protein B0A49_11150, partial [Cryomyces minteri]
GVVWEDGKHDDLLSERVKMKMTAIRSHMIAAGEIVRREGGYTGWKRAGEVDDLAEDLRAAEQLKAQLGEQGFQYLQQEAQQRMVQDSQQAQHAANHTSHGRAHQAADNTVHEHEDPTHQAQQALHHAAAHHSLEQNIHNHSSAMQEDVQQQQQQQQQPGQGSVQYDGHYVNPYAMPQRQQQQQQQMPQLTSQTGLHHEGQIDPSLQTLELVVLPLASSLALTLPSPTKPPAPIMLSDAPVPHVDASATASLDPVRSSPPLGTTFA